MIMSNITVIQTEQSEDLLLLFKNILIRKSFPPRCILGSFLQQYCLTSCGTVQPTVNIPSHTNVMPLIALYMFSRWNKPTELYKSRTLIIDKITNKMSQLIRMIFKIDENYFRLFLTVKLWVLQAPDGNRTHNLIVRGNTHY